MVYLFVVFGVAIGARRLGFGLPYRKLTFNILVLS